jgi:hypothetical protein
VLPKRFHQANLIQEGNGRTAIPPNGVTARCVSRRIKRLSDNKASISRGTGLSAAPKSAFEKGHTDEHEPNHRKRMSASGVSGKHS